MSLFSLKLFFNFSFLFFPLFIYLAVLGLSRGMQALPSSFWHVGSSSLTRDQTEAPLHWEHRFLTPGPPGKSKTSVFMTKMRLIPQSDSV